MSELAFSSVTVLYALTIFSLYTIMVFLKAWGGMAPWWEVNSRIWVCHLQPGNFCVWKRCNAGLWSDFHRQSPGDTLTYWPTCDENLSYMQPPISDRPTINYTWAVVLSCATDATTCHSSNHCCSMVHRHWTWCCKSTFRIHWLGFTCVHKPDTSNLSSFLCIVCSLIKFLMLMTFNII